MRQGAYLILSVCFLAGCGNAEPSNSEAHEIVSRGTSLALACTSCHLGEDSSGVMPSLAGWTSDDLRASLRDYKTSESGATVMHRLMRGYSDEDIDLIADYIGQDYD